MTLSINYLVNHFNHLGRSYNFAAEQSRVTLSINYLVNHFNPLGRSYNFAVITISNNDEKNVVLCS